MKLHLGCGERRLPEFINIDSRQTQATDYVTDAATLPFPDGSVERIETYHMIEHLSLQHLAAALDEWQRVLVPGGVLVIECPDFDALVKEYLGGNAGRLRNIFGARRFPGDAHQHGWNFSRLEALLREHGFHSIRQADAQDYHRLEEPCLRVEALAGPERPILAIGKLEPVADIIIPVWNHLDLTRRVVQSVRENTSVPYRLIVVDDGSTDGTAEWLAEQDDITVITNEANRGFAPSVNRGLRATTAPYVVLMNNDVEVDKLWLEALIEGMNVRPRIGAIGPLSTARRQIQWEGHHLGKGGVWLGVEYLAFFCTVLRREAVEETGLLDEGFAPAYGEDDDYAIRMRRAGWELALHCDVLVKHDHGQTTGPAGLARYHGAAYRRLREKWGKKIWVSILNQGEIRPELSELVSRMRQHPLHQVHVEYPSLKPIAHNRNSIVKRVLASDADFLLMIDDDITPSRNPLDLVTLDKDILGLPCYSWNPSVNPESPLYLVIMEYVGEKQAHRPALMRNDAGLTRLTAKGKPIDAVGTGAILIARRVLEQVTAPFERFWDEDGIQQMGLDFAFCLKARQLGFEVWTHMDYLCGHWVTLNLWDVQKIIDRG